jgi:hypothetical protein
MTGLPEYNFPAFHAAEARLRARGYDVANPARHGVIEGAQWQDYMRLAITALMTCDGVAVLTGWQQSRGATIEVDIARRLSMPVEPATAWGRRAAG